MCNHLDGYRHANRIDQTWTVYCVRMYLVLPWFPHINALMTMKHTHTESQCKWQSLYQLSLSFPPSNNLMNHWNSSLSYYPIAAVYADYCESSILSKNMDEEEGCLLFVLLGLGYNKIDFKVNNNYSMFDHHAVFSSLFLIQRNPIKWPPMKQTHGRWNVDLCAIASRLEW